MRTARAAIFGAVLLSCSHRTTPSERAPDEKAALGGDVAVRVGGQAIPVSLVASVAQANHIAAQDAARRVIDDEIAASAARARGLDQKRPTSWNLTAVRARIVADRLLHEAKSGGGPTEDEIGRLSELHWAEVDRPPMVRVIHAIALRPKKAGESTAPAQAVAQKLHDAAMGASSTEDFEARAKAVPHDASIDVRVETLPAFTSQGWIAGGGGMDPVFAKAAHALPAPGATTDVVETPFGWHVIRLIERLPEQRMSIEDRRTAFAEEVTAMRGHDAVTALLKTLTAKTPVKVSSAAESLMQSVPINTEQALNP